MPAVNGRPSRHHNAVNHTPQFSTTYASVTNTNEQTIANLTVAILHRTAGARLEVEESELAFKKVRRLVAFRASAAALRRLHNRVVAPLIGRPAAAHSGLDHLRSSSGLGKRGRTVHSIRIARLDRRTDQPGWPDLPHSGL